jgi:hypothetical protein
MKIVCKTRGVEVLLREVGLPVTRPRLLVLAVSPRANRDIFAGQRARK